MALTSSSTAPITRYPRRASIPSLVPGDRRTGVSSASCGIRQLSFCARLIGGGPAAAPPSADEPGAETQLADAAAGAAHTRAVVPRHQARDAGPARVPRDRRDAAARQGHSARRRMRGTETPMTRPDPTGPDPPQRPSRGQPAGGDQRPSPGLQVAAMLARAGWSAERLVRAFGLPSAFAEALHRDAIATGERRPGDDARLAEALRQLQARPRQTRTSRSRLPPTSGPAPQPPGDRPGPGGHLVAAAPGRTS